MRTSQLNSSPECQMTTGMRISSRTCSGLLLAGAVCLGVSVMTQAGPAQARPMSLAGSWRFALDPLDAGLAERWFERTLSLRIRLPGALQNQEFGDDITVDTNGRAR